MVFPRLSKSIVVAIVIDLLAIFLLVWKFVSLDTALISPLAAGYEELFQPSRRRPGYEVFGFAPYWNIDKLEAVDFSTLTTLAYFGVPVAANGSYEESDRGYIVLQSDKLAAVLARARANGTRTVLTLTQMDNATIAEFLDNPEAQDLSISKTLDLVRVHGFTGVNIDFEYNGDPGDVYRAKFAGYIGHFADSLHQRVPGSHLSVSVYAASVKVKKLYDVRRLAAVSDAIFIMAYDFAVASSDTAMPTAPLTGHKTGQYWYDVSSAVDDFLTQAPREKLILGVPWYGYLYAVSEPKVTASASQGYYVNYRQGKKRYRYWVRIPGEAATYAVVAKNLTSAIDGATAHENGWDEHGQVPWKAYLAADGIWRMVFYDDVTSLAKKYDFAKDRQLAGVGIWALGYEEGRREMWVLLAEKFGNDLTRAYAELAKKI